MQSRKSNFCFTAWKPYAVIKSRAAFCHSIKIYFCSLYCSLHFIDGVDLQSEQVLRLRAKLSFNCRK